MNLFYKHLVEWMAMVNEWIMHAVAYSLSRLKVVYIFIVGGAMGRKDADYTHLNTFIISR